jgi:inorganic phosphate transporter, PiT family
MVDTLVWFCIVIAFLISFAIGANDAANALGTSYGSNALPLKWLLCLGASCEFIGACFLSTGLADKLAISIIPDLETYPAQLQEQMMLSASIASATFIFISVGFAVPISGTHTIIVH